MLIDKCNEMHSIDLAWLRRQKLLNVGRWSTIRWSRGGQETGSIRLECFDDRVRLVYRARERGEDWIDVSEEIPLLNTSPNLGGSRQWFQCLSCKSRCRILYGGTRFRCRRCLGLKYDTQYEPPFARAATRALKTREKLGCREGIDAPFPEKPRGMHWKTYERLVAADDQLQHAWAAGIFARFRLDERH